MIADTYNLNLSDRYLPNWKAWEVAREIICNGLDADPNGIRIESLDRDTLVVSTTTAPEIGDVFVIGGGTKAPGGETIGQFGEGMKMAALVATRDGSGMTVNIPGYEITFGFNEVMGNRVLHSEIHKHPAVSEGMTVTVKMPGITNAYAGKILLNQPEGPVCRTTRGMTVYYKGVYITGLHGDSIWDWNLNGLEINRDRGMVEQASVLECIAKWFDKNFTPEHCDFLVDNPDSLEVGMYLRYYTGPAFKKEMAAAFYRLHGEKACLATSDDADNARARRAGYTPIHISETNLCSILANGGVVQSSSVKRDYIDWEPVDIEKYAEKAKRLRDLADLLNAPGYTLCVFANRTVKYLGFADIPERKIWVREDIVQDGGPTLAGTFLHELAHIISGASDETTEFEHALTKMLGELAVAL